MGSWGGYRGGGPDAREPSRRRLPPSKGQSVAQRPVGGRAHDGVNLQRGQSKRAKRVIVSRLFARVTTLLTRSRWSQSDAQRCGGRIAAHASFRSKCSTNERDSDQQRCAQSNLAAHSTSRRVDLSSHPADAHFPHSRSAKWKASVAACPCSTPTDCPPRLRDADDFPAQNSE
jgi:hypothetical protein